MPTTPRHSPVEPSGLSAEHKAAFRQRIVTWVKAHRTRTIIAVGILLVSPVFAWAYYENTHVIPAPEVAAKPKPAPKEEPKIFSPLTGLPVSGEDSKRPVIATIIENHPDARPQSGLSQAGVVYEALAEGGITRYMALFQNDVPKQIGPVRSLRTYFQDWALEFAVPVAHAGGNADAIDQIGALGMKSMNALYGQPSSYFTRAKDRYAPHNLYITGDQLTSLAGKLGYGGAPTFTPSPRKKDEPTTAPTHGLIQINYSYNGYQVEYRYDAATNSYARFLAGSPDIDRNTGQQIKVKNVVIQYMPTSFGVTRIGEQTVIMGTPGSGKTVVLRDGGAIEGTWSKANHNTRTQLLDAAGKDIPLVAGNTWYSIVPIGKEVSY